MVSSRLAVRTTEKSDLDVLVDFQSAPTFMNFMGLQEYLEEAFAAPVELVTRAALRERLRARVEAEALWVG